jgi:hypothetical protein
VCICGGSFVGGDGSARGPCRLCQRWCAGRGQVVCISNCCGATTPETSVYYQLLWGHDDGVARTMAWTRRRRGRDYGTAETGELRDTAWSRRRRVDGVVVMPSASLLHLLLHYSHNNQRQLLLAQHSIYLSSLGRRRRRHVACCCCCCDRRRQHVGCCGR